MPNGKQKAQAFCPSAASGTQDGSAWLADGLPPLTVAVNISALQFRKAGFLERVRQVIADSGALPDRLELELTWNAREVEQLRKALEGKQMDGKAKRVFSELQLQERTLQSTLMTTKQSLAAVKGEA